MWVLDDFTPTPTHVPALLAPDQEVGARIAEMSAQHDAAELRSAWVAERVARPRGSRGCMIASRGNCSWWGLRVSVTPPVN
jgi:hypothetical protein